MTDIVTIGDVETDRLARNVTSDVRELVLVTIAEIVLEDDVERAAVDVTNMVAVALKIEVTDALAVTEFVGDMLVETDKRLVNEFKLE